MRGVLTGEAGAGAASTAGAVEAAEGVAAVGVGAILASTGRAGAAEGELDVPVDAPAADLVEPAVATAMPADSDFSASGAVPAGVASVPGAAVAAARPGVLASASALRKLRVAEPDPASRGWARSCAARAA